MENRRLGRTEHLSSVLTFGAAALWQVTEAEAEAAIDLAVGHGVNHIDVAPSYGQAEIRLGPWLEKHRNSVFLACKTGERSKAGAWESIKQSLDRLRVDHFDLFQFHAVNDVETLNVILGPGGALEAVLEAKEQKLLRHIGITGHRPFVLVDAIQRFQFDTVLFPLSRVLAAHRNDYTDFSILLDQARQKDVGTIAIKSVARQPWQGTMHMYRTWYEPFSRQADIDKCLWYTLSQGVTTAAMPGDLSLWPLLIDAAERLRALDEQEQDEMVSEARRYRPIFPPA
ncbi:MAG: aldo/keto reductase [Dehalococcoidales bacterium]|nr:aldo/keto reductase [Dehalococcoidales bacterium]